MHTGTKKAQTPCGYLEKTIILMQKRYAALPHLGSAWLELRYLYGCRLGRCIHQKSLSRHYARFHANSRTHQFWQQDNHSIALVSPKVIWQKVDYIHQNPVRAGWVEKEEEYLYSSARNYTFENEGCLLEVDLLEPYLPGSSFVYLPGFDDQE